MISLHDAVTQRLMGNYRVDQIDGRKFVRVDAVEFYMHKGNWSVDFLQGRNCVCEKQGTLLAAFGTSRVDNLDLWLPVTEKGVTYDKRYRW